MRMCLYCSWQPFRGYGALQPCLMIRSSWERSDMECGKVVVVVLFQLYRKLQNASISHSAEP